MACSFRRISLLLILCGCALPGDAAAAAAGVSEEGGTPPTGKSVGELDEVTVIGQKLRELQREVIEAEDRFYERFNALNTKDDFDIHCQMEKATGTNVPQRQCRIQFLLNAAALDGREFTLGLTNGRGGVNTPAARLQLLWLQRREEYQQTAKALLERDPELLALGAELAGRREQYDRVRKERQKGFLNLFE